MKKKCLPLIGILLISALSAIAFSACDKDTFCYLDVTVIDSKYDNAPAGGAWVKVQYVKKNESDPMNNVVGTISDTGQCNENGIYKTKFAAPAIFTITARVKEPDTLNNKEYYREGEKSIRLKESEVVTATVKIIGEKVLGRAYFQEIS